MQLMLNKMLRNAGLANGIPSVFLVVFKQPGANVVETVDRVKEMIPILKDTIPRELLICR